MFEYALCAFLAPALTAAAAFPWALPDPTLVIPAIDSWSPNPTEPPQAAALELFKRAEETLCGYVSGISTSSLTCPGSSSACATLTFNGVHGCCDPKDMSACNIPTTCIPSASMSASCTDSQCSSDDLIAKCTGSKATECYEYHFVYSTEEAMTLTEWGCAATAVTLTVERTYSGQSVPERSTSFEPKTSSAAVTGTASSSPSPTTLEQTTSNSKRNSTAPIIGGAIGGIAVVGALAFGIVYLILRNRRQKREVAAHQSYISHGSGPSPGVTEYNPHGFTSTSPWQEQGVKSWPGIGVTDCGPGRSDATLFGVVESAGTPVHEAPA